MGHIEDSAADSKRRREEKKQRDEASREKLLAHITQQDERLALEALDKRALKEKRLYDEFDPSPAPRQMYDDQVLAMAAKIPGPGEYTPRLPANGADHGKTLSSTFKPTVSSESSGVPYEIYTDREACSMAEWRVKDAAVQPGPGSYSPRRQHGVSGGRHPENLTSGSTFGLSEELLGGKVPNDAHDISKMVSHLRDLPAPDAYAVIGRTRDQPVENNKGFRMVPSKALSSLEQVMQNAAKVPGPGRYESHSQALGPLSAGRTSHYSLGGAGLIKSDLQITMERAEQLPGPGAYANHSQLRSTGAPRFGKNESSLIASIQVEARTKPGPGAYHPTPTFAEELAMQRYLRARVKGSPRSARASPRGKLDPIASAA